MNNCGLPKGCEDQCCLNRSGMCTLDTADYSDIDRAVGMRGCGFIGVNDRYMLWKYEVPYKDFVCGNCQHYKGDTHGVCTTDRDHGYSNSRYSGAHACGDFKKRKGDEDMAKQTYYTKCGREFQKNSTAEVTGYELNELDKKLIVQNCIECPFPIEVTEGWGENKKHVRFECRAGTKKPNHTTEWTGSLEDKNTIQIHSLDHQLMEEIKEFCENHSDLGAGYNADHMADCRRTLAINCSSNKKGIAAKKALIEKFFPVVEIVPEENKQMKKHCVDCVSCQKSGVGEGHPFQHKCFNAAHRPGLEFYFPDNCEACGNFEQKEHVEEATGMYHLEDEKKCKTKNEACGYYCKHNEGCALLIITGKALNSTLKLGQVDCNIWREKAGIANDILQNDTKSLEIVTEVKDIAIFDYSTVDTDTADFLQDKAEKIATIRMRSVMAIGKELKEAHEKLANNKTGTFEKWVLSLGITHQTSRNYINAYDYMLKNFEDITAADQIQPSLLFAVSKPSAPAELQQAVLAGDIKTNKEYQEALEELKATKEALAQAEFHYKTVDESYKRLEKVNTDHYQKRVQAEQAIATLQSEINSLKSSSNSSDKNEVAKLQNTIKLYQDQVEELNEQLFSKPIETQATTIKEVVPAEVQAELQRLTTENRLLSEQQTSTSKAIESIIQGASRVTAELTAYLTITRSEIPKFSQIPPAVKDTVYQSLSALKCYVLDLENVTRQFKE